MSRSLDRFGTAVSGKAMAHLHGRVQLYLLVMLLVDLSAHVSDFVAPLFFEGLQRPVYPIGTLIVRFAATVLIAGAWAWVRYARPPRAVLVASEMAVTFGLALVYVRVATTHMSGAVADFAPVFTMFGLMLLLGVRASLVPSPVLRTVVIGALCVGALFVFGRERIAALDPMILDGLSFIGAVYVLATGVTSHVIYGLRREVLAAQQLGQYTLEQKLGEGGMGSVHRARHALLRRPAAIKLVRPELLGADGTGTTAADQVLQRFEREADATASLKSPHTVELYDFGVSERGEFYIVMELLDGIELETMVVRHGPLPPARVVFLLLQVCASLEEAHAAGLIHRDVKPANVFVCRHGLRHDFVKVLDFGLVGVTREQPTVEEAKLTVDGRITGTPAYLPPEMASRPDTVDARADLYALGCVAHWALTGHVPFERPTAMATVLAHVNEAPLPPSARSETPIPPELDAVVLDCLAKRPEDRPSSAAELADRLRAVVVPNGWDEDAAARWWQVHQPVTDVTAPAPVEDTELRVTRALR